VRLASAINCLANWLIGVVFFCVNIPVLDFDL